MDFTGSSSASSGDLLVPSINFNLLCQGVYRSGYPTKKNFPFLCSLGLRSICYLCPEEYAQANQKFCEEQNIVLARFPMEGNKEPFVDIPEEIVHRALSFLSDSNNHPVLIHCNKGKHRTGTICGCLRLLQGWSMVSIFQEYIRFAGDKARSGDQQFIELYHPVLLLRQGAALASWVDKAYLGRAFTIAPDETTFDAIVAQRGRVSLLSGGHHNKAHLCEEALEKKDTEGQGKHKIAAAAPSSPPLTNAAAPSSPGRNGQLPPSPPLADLVLSLPKKEKKDKSAKGLAT